jgi:crossover junction endodeoxyribonuclease RusA
MIQFTVYGEPATAGSKRGFYNKALGRVIMAPDNKRQKPWMQQVAGTAREAYRGELLTGPVRLRVTFNLQRTKGHFGTGKNAGIVKASAPEHHTKKPDLTKLVRAIEDALTGIIWKDDSQVFFQQNIKRYTTRGSHTVIEIEEA